MPMLCARRLLIVALVILPATMVRAGDWPQFRGDAARTGYVSEQLPSQLTLAWTYESSHPPTPAWPTNDRLSFDRAFHPVIANGVLYFGSSVDGKVYALDAATGLQRWTFFTDAPIRFAPAVWKQRVYVASDDGHLYCLSANEGQLVWKHRGGPSNRMVLGNDRMTSAWPARGGPVVKNGVVYFAAGIWPSDGFFLHAFDASTGKKIWSNTDSGSIYMAQPHDGAFARSGVSAQGYLVAAGANLLVPTGRAVPAAFDIATGKLRYFHLGTHSSMGGDRVMALGDFFFNSGYPFEAKSGLAAYPPPKQMGPVAALSIEGGHFVRATAKSVTAYKMAEFQQPDRKGKPITVKGARELWSIDAPAAGSAIVVAGRTIYSGGPNGVCAIDADKRNVVWSATVDGMASGLAAAGGRLYVSTDRGRIHCFSSEGGRESVVIAQSTSFSDDDAPSVYVKVAKEILAKAGIDEGYCIDLGCGEGELALALARQSKLTIYAVDPDRAKVEKARGKLSSAGLYGRRVTVHHAKLDDIHYPKYFANLIVSGRSATEESDETLKTVSEEMSRLQRPYGGALCVGKPGSMRIRVRGELTGAGSWTHQYANAANTICSDDRLIKGPLAMLWFRDADLPLSARHGRRPAPLFHRGRLLVQGRAIRAVDAYNGRTLWEYAPKASLQLYNFDRTGSNFCIGEDGVFVRVANKCLRLGLSTGKKLAEFEIPSRPNEEPDEKPGLWGYIALADGLLFGSRTNTDHVVLSNYNTANYGQGMPESSSLWAMDAKTGKLKWTYTARHSIRHNAIAIGQGHVYLIDRQIAKMDRLRRGKAKEAEKHLNGELVCMNAQTGAVRWKVEDVWGTVLSLSTRHDALLMCYQSSHYTLPSERGGRIMALRASDGKPLWDRKIHYTTRPLINDRTVYAQEGAWDLLTGEDRPFKLSRSYGCGQISSSKNVMLFRSATLGYFDLTRKAGTENYGGIRLGCWINAIPAGGIVLVPDGSTCTCSYLNRASFALQQVGSK